MELGGHGVDRYPEVADLIGWEGGKLDGLVASFADRFGEGADGRGDGPTQDEGEDEQRQEGEG